MMSQALIEQVRLLLHTVDWDPNASDGEIIQAIDWVELRVAFERATAKPDLEPTDETPLRCQECNGTNVHVAVGPGFKPSPWCEDCKDFVTLTQDLEPNDYALCVHCGASHHMDDDHQCEGEE